MTSSHYPTLHLKDLDGKSADPFGLPLPEGLNSGKTSLAVIPHATLGHVAVVVEEPPGHFKTRFLNREEAAPLLRAADPDRRTG